MGLERKIANLTADLGYVGTAAQKLPRISFPNAYPGATPEFAPYTQFNSAGDVTGGKCSTAKNRRLSLPSISAHSCR